MKSRVVSSVAVIVVLALAAGCGREARVPQAPATEDGSLAVGAEAPPAGVGARLEDVVETAPGYIIGISYPEVASQHPGLAAELERYARRMRGGVIEAAQQRATTPGAPLYDLTLTFTALVDTPAVVAVAADGSRYVGGEHSEPLVARFVWLPQQQRLLTAEELIPGGASWKAIARDVGEQLYTALSQRIDADELSMEDRAQVVTDTGGMIEQGAAAHARHFSTFEPVMTPQGRIGALKFMFPQRQVAPDPVGAQTIEVPAEVLLPHVAPQYRPLFAEAAS
jgi:hypothetical protein